MVFYCNIYLLRQKKIGKTYLFLLVPLAGLEPARMLLRGILSPLRLPIPPQRHYLEAPPRFELGVEALQAHALPLGYGADTKKGDKPHKIKNGAGNEIRTRDICLGKATLYH